MRSARVLFKSKSVGSVGIASGARFMATSCSAHNAGASPVSFQMAGMRLQRR